MVESSLVTYKDTVIDYSEGTAMSVEFRFEYIWKYKKITEQQNVFHPMYLHFIHVHPLSILTYSQLDKNCLKGFTLAFGYPVIFSIVVFPSHNIHDLEYDMLSYQYIQNNMKEVSTPKIKTEHLIILKLLAYRGY